MDVTYLAAFYDSLGRLGVEFDPGLTNEEMDRIENTYGFRFPPDLRALLQYALPVSPQWVNWRDAAQEPAIRASLAWPAEGICFDVEHNNFWMAAWGPRTTSLEEALSVARRHIAEAPTLIPIYSHRYIPSEPALPGNPVFSVYQTDIIYYGNDLASYFPQEFASKVRQFSQSLGKQEGWRVEQVRIPNPYWAARTPRPIRFWSEIVEGNVSP